ncbi:hypothetical protein HN873_039219, partial [Arachis hypogaea]
LLETAIDVRERRSFKISRLPYPFHLVLRAAILQHSKLAFALQLKRVMESDSALTEDLIAYNIIPLDAASSTNAFVSFPEESGDVAREELGRLQMHCGTTRS